MITRAPRLDTKLCTSTTTRNRINLLPVVYLMTERQEYTSVDSGASILEIFVFFVLLLSDMKSLARFLSVCGEVAE